MILLVLGQSPGFGVEYRGSVTDRETVGHLSGRIVRQSGARARRSYFDLRISATKLVGQAPLKRPMIPDLRPPQGFAYLQADVLERFP